MRSGDSLLTAAWAFQDDEKSFYSDQKAPQHCIEARLTGLYQSFNILMFEWRRGSFVVRQEAEVWAGCSGIMRTLIEHQPAVAYRRGASRPILTS